MSSFSTNQNNLFNKNFLVVPPEAAYTPLPHSDDFILSHRLKKIWPETNSTLGENASMRFHIYGAGQHLDTKSLRLFFKARCRYPNGDGPLNTFDYYEPTRFTEWIGSIFRTVEVRLNNQTLVSRIDYRNILHNMISLYTVPDSWKSSIAGQNEFYCNKLMYRTSSGEMKYAPASTLMELSKKDQSYCLELDLENILQTQKYLPMDLIRSIDIELITDTFKRVTTKDWGTLNAATFKLGDPFGEPQTYVRIATDGVNPTLLDRSDGSKVAVTYKNTQAFDSMTNNIRDISELLPNEKTEITAQQIIWDPELAYSINDNGNVSTYGTYDEYKAAKDSERSKNSLWRTFEVSEYYMTADFYTFSDAYRASLEQALLSTGVLIPMESWLTVTENITKGSTHELRIRRSLTSLKTLLISFENAKLISDCQVDTPDGKIYVSDGLSHFDLYGLKNYQIMLNGIPIQGHKIKTSYTQGSRAQEDDNAEHIYETLKAFSIHGDTMITGSQGDGLFKSGPELPSIYTADDLLGVGYYESLLRAPDAEDIHPEQAPRSFDQVPDYRRMKQNNIIAVNFDKSTQVSGESMEELVILLEFDQEKIPAEGLLAHCFLHFDQHLQIKPGYDFTIHE